MMPTTGAWVKKAEGDYDVVCVLLRSRKRSRYDAICFHCQQCVEKYLKARLIEAGVAFPKTHELRVLLQIVVPVEPPWSFATEMRTLAMWAVMPRYPGVDATNALAKQAVGICRGFRKTARRALGLKP
jgi:HEPN domain-containing protein